MSWDKYDSLVGEDDVFMTLDLPRDNSESRCGSEGSGSQSEYSLIFVPIPFNLV